MCRCNWWMILLSLGVRTCVPHSACKVKWIREAGPKLEYRHQKLVQYKSTAHPVDEANNHSVPVKVADSVSCLLVTRPTQVVLDGATRNENKSLRNEMILVRYRRVSSTIVRSKKTLLEDATLTRWKFREPSWTWCFHRPWRREAGMFCLSCPWLLN